MQRYGAEATLSRTSMNLARTKGPRLFDGRDEPVADEIRASGTVSYSGLAIRPVSAVSQRSVIGVTRRLHSPSELASQDTGRVTGHPETDPASHIEEGKLGG